MANGDDGLIGATTLPGGHAGLVATFPASCGVVPGFRCVRITDTATLSSVTVRSPSRHGFGIGGAFSADGRWLAAFGGRPDIRPSRSCSELSMPSSAFTRYSRNRQHHSAHDSAPVPNRA